MGSHSSTLVTNVQTRMTNGVGTHWSLDILHWSFTPAVACGGGCRTPLAPRRGGGRFCTCRTYVLRWLELSSCRSSESGGQLSGGRRRRNRAGLRHEEHARPGRRGSGEGKRLNIWRLAETCKGRAARFLPYGDSNSGTSCDSGKLGRLSRPQRPPQRHPTHRPGSPAGPGFWRFSRKNCRRMSPHSWARTPLTTSAA